MTSWPGAVAVLIALVVASLLRRVLRLPATPGHNSALDGLRGFLAFGVFLHHAVVWYFHLQDGSWGHPPLAVYRELGLDCVNFFFMITAFLFVGKVIEGRERPIDWLRLYVGRFLRIVPLYILVVCALLIAVGHATDWRLQEPLPELLHHIGQWLLFGMAHTTAVNGYGMTGMLIAFVTWTLAYEWMFYFSLPLIAVLLGVHVRLTVLFTATGVMVLIALGIPDLFFPSAFVIGAVVAFVARQERVALMLRGRLAALLTLLVIAILLSGRVPHRAAVLFETVAFCVIACGNTLFGILSNRAAVELGEVSYGTYLIHSLLLSVTFLFVLGPEASRALSPPTFWAAIFAIGAMVVLLSTLTYRYIELPMLRNAGRVTVAIRKFVGRFAAHGAAR